MKICSEIEWGEEIDSQMCTKGQTTITMNRSKTCLNIPTTFYLFNTYLHFARTQN